MGCRWASGCWLCSGWSTVKTEKPSPAPVAKKPVAESGNGKGTVDQLLILIGEKSLELGFGPALEPGGSLTAVGKKFAAEHIAPVCDERGIPRNFGRMTPAQTKELMDVLKALKKPEPEGDEF